MLITVILLEKTNSIKSVGKTPIVGANGCVKHSKLFIRLLSTKFKATTQFCKTGSGFVLKKKLADPQKMYADPQPWNSNFNAIFVVGPEQEIYDYDYEALEDIWLKAGEIEAAQAAHPDEGYGVG